MKLNTDLDGVWGALAVLLAFLYVVAAFALSLGVPAAIIYYLVTR